MHSATLNGSRRLQRVRKLLADGKPHSTMEIIQRANVCAVNSIVSELRANGMAIDCRREGRRWYYRLGA